MSNRELFKKLENVEELSLEDKNKIKKALTQNKKYGLVWEDHPEDVDLELKDGTFKVTGIEDKRIKMDPEGRENILFEGDNLHTLMFMKEAGMKVDVIYIDPPYNTMNEKGFIYNDKYIDSEDDYRHSKWLSFMERRLEVAHELLTNEGVIFISIGNDEHYNLRLLMNQIYGSESYIGTLIRRTKSGGNKGSYFSPSYDYVLVYAKDRTLLPNFTESPSESTLERYKHEDELGRYQLRVLNSAGLDVRPNQRYWVKCPDGTYAIPEGEKYPSPKLGKIVSPDRSDNIFTWSLERYEEELGKGNIVFKKTSKSPLYTESGVRSEWNVYRKLYLPDNYQVLPEDMVLDFPNRLSSTELNSIGLDFSYPKPVGLISWLLDITNKPNATVLDFFAGSGTTGQSVMELNKEDGGNRRFILATNNENNIAEEVTYERNRRVITGEWASGDKDPLPNNLSYYKVDIENKNNITLDEKHELDTYNKMIQLLIKDELRIEEINDDYAILVKSNYKVLFLLTDCINDNIRNLNNDEFNGVYTPIVTNRDKFFKRTDDSKITFY